MKKLRNFRLSIKLIFDKSSFDFFEDYIIKTQTNEEYIIKYSIKFIRLLNTYIVDDGTKYNSEDRVVYRGVKADILKDAIAGETYIIKAYITKIFSVL